MEPAAATRGGPLPLLASQAQRKEWRAVSEHSFRSNGSEEVERGKLSQSDERTKYEEGAGQLDVNFCSITIDGGDLNEDIAGAQRIHEIARQRMELQELEIELKARAIARQTVLEVQHKYEEEVKEHAEATVQLKGQLHEKELYIRECEMKLEEKERELQALKIDSEAAWAKEDLLREQNNELATFRRERDNSEAERAHHLKQIHDLQEHIQEKETQFLELQEQHRVAQETIIYKDEQLRETQAWVARVQEMDALQSTTNQSLQAELRERTEQFNHYWGLLLRQYVDMERHYVQVIQQLQLELTGSKERSGSHNDDSPIASSNPQQPSTHVQNNGNQFSGSENGVIANSETASNDCFKSEPPLSLAMNLSSKNEHIPGAPMIPSSIFGMGAYAQPSQVNALQSFAMHPQAVPHPVGSAEPHVSQSQLGNFQTGTATPTVQNWQTQLAVSENPDMPNQLYRRQSGPDQNNLQSDAHKSYDHSGNKQVNHSEYGKPDSSQKPDSSPKPMFSDINNESTEDLQVTNEKFLDSSGEQYLLYEESVETVSDDSQYHPSLRVKPSDQDFKSKDDVSAVANNELQDSVLESEPQDDTSLIVSAASTNSQCLNDTSKSNISTSGATSLFAPVKASTPALLDERSLLACIVRAIPLGSNGKIRISTTLPNRLGKMLAPLHWHDYRKQYGKLDDFMNLHPELFVIEGDFIHLRDGAQEIVSANAAAAKFAAAAASASASYLSHSIAVTPIAQGHQQKWYQSADVKCGSANLNNGSSLLVTSRESSNKHLQHLTMQNQQPNNISFDILQGLSNVNILSNLKDTREVNDLSSELKSGPAPGRNVAANGTDVDQAGIAPSQIKGMNRARNGPGGRQQGRTVNNGLIPRR